MLAPPHPPPCPHNLFSDMRFLYPVVPPPPPPHLTSHFCLSVVFVCPLLSLCCLCLSVCDEFCQCGWFCLTIQFHSFRKRYTGKYGRNVGICSEDSKHAQWGDGLMNHCLFNSFQYSKKGPRCCEQRGLSVTQSLSVYFPSPGIEATRNFIRRNSNKKGA